MPASLHAAAAPLTLVPLQELPVAPTGPVGTLLVALVVVALVVFIGRYVMSMAWRLVKIAIVVVGLAWLALNVAPMVGL